jgi:hypothetical protein
MSDHFELTHTDAFESRKDLVPWVLAGTVASLHDRPDAEANLWTNIEKRVFVEFLSDGYAYHYELSNANGHAFTPEQQDEVSEFLQERLVTWVIEGIDDDVLNM